MKRPLSGFVSRQPLRAVHLRDSALPVLSPIFGGCQQDFRRFSEIFRGSGHCPTEGCGRPNGLWLPGRLTGGRKESRGCRGRGSWVVKSGGDYPYQAARRHRTRKPQVRRGNYTGRAGRVKGFPNADA